MISTSKFIGNEGGCTHQFPENGYKLPVKCPNTNAYIPTHTHTHTAEKANLYYVPHVQGMGAKNWTVENWTVKTGQIHHCSLLSKQVSSWGSSCTRRGLGAKNSGQLGHEFSTAQSSLSTVGTPLFQHIPQFLYVNNLFGFKPTHSVVHELPQLFVPSTELYAVHGICQRPDYVALPCIFMRDLEGDVTTRNAAFLAPDWTAARLRRAVRAVLVEESGQVSKPLL